MIKLLKMSYITSGGKSQTDVLALLMIVLSLFIPIVSFADNSEPKLIGNDVISVFTQNVQQFEIKGYVYSQDKMPLFGASVQEEGTNNAVLVKKDGSYAIKVTAKKDLKLIFSFLGMKTKTIEVNQRKVINVVLDMVENKLTEVVVTGYGNIKKEEYTGSANVIESKDLAARPVSSFENALSGLSPGLMVSSSGQPGDIAEVRLRGFGSMNASSQPLYVIDGIVFDQANTSGHSNATSSPMATINPSDIASITILKDAASASLYGSQGANGVIVITTKQGVASDKLRFNFSAQGGVSSIFSAVRPNLVNAQQYKELWTEGQLHRLVQNIGGDFKLNLDELYKDKVNNYIGGKNYFEWQQVAQQDFNNYYALEKPDGTYYSYDFFGADADKLPNTDWYDEITRLARFQKYDFSLNAGSTSLKYLLSLGYQDQQGIIINSNMKRYAMRFNLNADDRKKLINWGLNSSVSGTEQSGSLTNGTAFNVPHTGATLIPSVIPVFLEDGSYNIKFPNNLLNGSHNPVASAIDNNRQRPQFSLLTSGWLRLNFKRWLNFTSDLSYLYITGRRMDYFSKEFGSGYITNGDLTNYNSRRTKLTNRNTLNFNYTIKNRHRFTALAAFELMDYKQAWSSVSVSNFLTDEKPVLSTGAEVYSWIGDGSDYSMVSLVSKFDYSYRNKYFIGASFRQDQSSMFSPEYRTGNFWSISGAYRLTNESWNWVKSIKSVINDIKFKGSYGYNGTLPSNYYSWRNLFDGTVRYNSSHALLQRYRGTYDLSWEKNKILNIGLETSMFNNKIKMTNEYYRRKSSDLLQDVPVSKVSGYNTMLMNTSAGLLNYGFETDIDASIINKAFKWNVKANIATLTSKYYGLENDIISTFIMRNGASVSAWYMNEFAGVNSNTGQLLYYAYDDAGNKLISNSDFPASRRIVGKGIPTVTGGVNNFLSYKGWELATLFTYGWGHDVFDGRKSSRIGVDGSSMDNNLEVSQLDRWTPDNIYASSRIRINGQTAPGVSTRYLYSGDYLKLKNIRLGYTFPANKSRKLFLNSVSVYGQAENLWVWTELQGYDPDMQIDGHIAATSRYPTATTFTFGLNMNF